MVVLRPIKISESFDLRKNFASVAFFTIRHAFVGHDFLPVIVSQNDGPILLRPGPGCRIVAAPKDLQKFIVGNDFRIEIHLKGFRMIAERSVSGIGLGAAGVSDAGSDHAFQAPEPGVVPPESPKAESGGLKYQGLRYVNRRYRTNVFMV